jgi:hypothetical protein
MQCGSSVILTKLEVVLVWLIELMNCLVSGSDDDNVKGGGSMVVANGLLSLLFRVVPC